MRQLVLALGVAVALLGCDKKENGDAAGTQNDPVKPSLSGNFEGTFHRTGMDTVSVKLTFPDDRRYQGSGVRRNYPAICGGTFTFDGNTLAIHDTCSWTADFDWSLIFDGNYNTSFDGPYNVRIWRTSASFTDEYLLTRIIR